MKPYGVPRVPEIECPDVADIQRFACASHVGRFPTKGGDYKPYTRNSGTRKASRRIWKRKARIAGKAMCRAQED